MIVRVARFGGSRTADPPAWGVWTRRGEVEIFFGLPDALLGSWNVESGGGHDFWLVPDRLVPDTVWAALAAWRLMQ